MAKQSGFLIGTERAAVDNCGCSTLDCGPGGPDSSPEFVPIFYRARSTAQGLL